MGNVEYFDKDYFEDGRGSNKSGYLKSTFSINNDVFKNQANLLIDILKLKNKVVVDLGCARNNLVYWLRKFDVYAWGQDISEWCYNNSHSFNYHKHGDINKGILFDNNSIDAVVSFETLEHMGNIDTLILDIRRILKPGGYFFATISSDGHSNDVSAISLRERNWWETKFNKVFSEQKDLLKIFNETLLVKSYCWKVYCYKNTGGD